MVCGVLAEFSAIAFEMMNWDQELLKAKDSASSPCKAAVVKGEDKEGKYEEYIIVADCQQLINIVDAVEVLEAFKRIPDEFRGFTFFGSADRWLYIKSGNPKLCENCLGFDSYIIRKWQEPKVIIQDAITKICT